MRDFKIINSSKTLPEGVSEPIWKDDFYQKDHVLNLGKYTEHDGDGLIQDKGDLVSLFSGRISPQVLSLNV